jgi:hypothetical protein
MRRTAQVLLAVTIVASGGCRGGGRSLESNLDPASLRGLVAHGSVQVAAPAEPVALVRVGNVRRDFWPLVRVVPDGDVRQILDQGPDELAVLLLGEPMARVVDLNGALEVGLFLADGEPAVRIGSMAVPDVARAFNVLATLYEPEPREAGRYRLLPRFGGPVQPLDARGAVCEIWQAAKARHGQIVCADSDTLLDARGEQMVERARQAQVQSGQVRVEIAESVVTEFALGLQPSTGGNAGEQLGEELVHDLVRGISGVTFDVKVDAGNVSLSTNLDFFRTASPLARLLLGLEGKQAPPPELELLPASTALALSGVGTRPGSADAELAELVKKVLLALPADSIDRSKTDQMAAAVQRLSRAGGPLVLGFGADVDGVQAALEAVLEAPDDPERARALKASLDSFVLLTFPQPLDEWVESYRRVLELDREMSRVEILRRAPTGASGGSRAGTTKATPLGERYVRTDPTERTVSDASEADPLKVKGFERPAVHFVWRQIENVAYQAPDGSRALPFVPGESHVLVAERQGRTWVCSASSVEECVKLLSEVAARGASAKAADRGERSGARSHAALGSVHANFAGYLDPAGLAAFFEEVHTVGQARVLLDQLRTAKADARRQVRIPFAGHAEPAKDGDPGSGTLRVEVSLPLDVLKSVFE